MCEKISMTVNRTSVVMVSPPDEKRWGFYQFPKIGQATHDELYLVVNVGADSQAGRHEPTQFFTSGDRGQSWEQVNVEKIDRPPETYTLPDGSQVTFGHKRRLHSYDALNPEPDSPRVACDELGLKPVAGPFANGYGVNEFMFFRYSDIPEKLRCFPLFVRFSPDNPWQQNTGTIDMPDLYLRALVRAMWWDDNGKKVWLEKQPEIFRPIPERIVVMPDSTLLWPYDSQHPDANQKYSRVTCLASMDAGHTWQPRGMIAGKLGETSWGYGGSEQSLARMPNGDLLCVMRTKMSNLASHTHYLAASRSTDQGCTWSKPVPIAEFCVTPRILTLRNNVTVLIYGRPGVYVRASIDNGYTWSDSISLVGPAEKDLLAKPLEEWWKLRHVFSCGNIDIVVSGPDRLLIAYSDFQYPAKEGAQCKAIKVSEVVVDHE